MAHKLSQCFSFDPSAVYINFSRFPEVGMSRTESYFSVEMVVINEANGCSSTFGCRSRSHRHTP